jgi:hypothetical protein
MATWIDVQQILSEKGEKWGYKVGVGNSCVLSWTLQSGNELPLSTFGRKFYPAVTVKLENGDSGIRIFSVIGNLNDYPELELMLRKVGEIGYGKVVVAQTQIQLSHLLPLEGLGRAELLASIQSIHDMAAFLRNAVASTQTAPGNRKLESKVSQNTGLKIGVAIAVLIAVIAIIIAGTSSNKSGDAAYNAGFSTGYNSSNFVPNSQAGSYCSDLWSNLSGNALAKYQGNQSMWVGGCTNGVKAAN